MCTFGISGGQLHSSFSMLPPHLPQDLLIIHVQLRVNHFDLDGVAAGGRGRSTGRAGATGGSRGLQEALMMSMAGAHRKRYMFSMCFQHGGQRRPWLFQPSSISSHVFPPHYPLPSYHCRHVHWHRQKHPKPPSSCTATPTRAHLRGGVAVVECTPPTLALTIQKLQSL